MKLVVLSPSLVSQPDQVKAILSAASDGSEPVERLVLDRVTEHAVTLKPDHYDHIHLATAGPDDHIDLKALGILDYAYKALKPSGILSGPDVAAPAALPTLLLAGFIKHNGQVIRPAVTKATTLLKRPAKTGVSKLPKFKRAADFSALTLDDDDDDLIDENSLVTDNAGTEALVANKCKLPGAKRRKRACKDCTCGMKELQEAEDKAMLNRQDTVIQLTVGETAEIDFTVAGKTTGSCSSCALGDAFRCDGCPYLGLPAFQPGQAVTIAAAGNDL